MKKLKGVEMGLIKLESGETVPDRRINGSRLKLDLADWLKVVSVIIILILGFGNIKWTVEANTKTINEHALKISIVERDMGTIKSDVSYIRGWIDKKIK